MKPHRLNPRKVLVALSGIALALGAFVLLRGRLPAKPTPGSDAAEARDLAVLMPHAGGCQLNAVRLPDLESRNLSVLPSDCAGAQLAFAPRLARALAWFTPADGEARSIAVFEIDLATRKFRRLPAPDGGEVDTFAYDAKGELHAYLVDQEVELIDTEQGRRVLRGEQSYPARPGADGLDAVARGLSWTDEGWKETEAVATRCCADAAPGIAVLPSYAAIIGSPALRELVAAHVRARVSPPEALQDPVLMRLLAREAGPTPDADGQPAQAFVRLTMPGWSTSLIARGDGFPVRYATGPLLLERDRRVAPAGPVFAATDLLELSGAGAFALVAEAFGGTRPVALDMRSGKTVYEERLAFAARFWPR